MPEQLAPVAYDEIAKFYDSRYNVGPLGVTEILRTAIDRVQAARILEVGCGTGHWLNMLANKRIALYGLDYSFGMLAKAKTKSPHFHLCRGDAAELPFKSSFFDLIYCIHAIHHFRSPENFIQNAFNLLRPGGLLIIIGMDPHLGRDNWYVYDFFPSTKPADLQRYPSSSNLRQYMQHTGFIDCQCIIEAKLQHDFVGADVLHDPVLQKNGASQLSLLGEQEFADGMQCIKNAINNISNHGKQLIFPAHIVLPAIIGSVPW